MHQYIKDRGNNKNLGQNLGSDRNLGSYIRYKELRKKAQLQAMELIAVLFIFFILLSVGIYYYYQFQFTGIKETTERLSTEKLEVYLSAIINMPEFQCSARAAKEICLDTTKLLLFKTSELAKTAILPKARITVKQIYPIKTALKECTLQDFNSPDFPDNCLYFTIKDFKLPEKKSVISNPVLLYYSTKNLYALGLVIMEVA